MWRDGTDFDPGKLNAEPVEKTLTRTVYWEIKKPQAGRTVR